MRKKTRQEESSETLTREIKDEEQDEKKGSFFACYILVSLSPRHKGQTYIGFTVNPRRRIRQHNGEIQCGAWRTKKKRPWEMVLCIHGFPSNVAALKFEWAWQHPNESLAVRKAAASFKSLSGIANKIKLAFTMLNLPSWQSMNLTVNYFSTKYTNNSAGCPSLPRQMKVRIRPMDDLPCYVVGRESFPGEDSEWDDDKWKDESSDETAKDPEEEALSNRVFESSQEHDMSGVDETSNNDSEEGTTLSPLVKDDGFRSESPITLDDDEVEVKDSEDIPSNCVFESSEERDTSNACDRSRWTDSEADHRGWSCFDRSIKRPCSPSIEAGNHSFVEEISNDTTTLSPWIKNGGFRSESLITLDDDEEPPPQERQRRIAGNEIEVIDVSTPSPLCGNSLRGKKRRLYTVFPNFIDLTNSPGFVQL